MTRHDPSKRERLHYSGVTINDHRAISDERMVPGLQDRRFIRSRPVLGEIGDDNFFGVCRGIGQDDPKMFLAMTRKPYQEVLAGSNRHSRMT